MMARFGRTVMRQKRCSAAKLVLIGIFAVAWIIGGVFGVSSLASAAPQTITIDFHDSAYYIGEASYEKLNDAIATAADGDTVMLNLPEDHVVQNQSITITQDITLSGSLTTAVLEDEDGIVIEGNVTFSDLTFRSGHPIPTISAVTVRPGGKLTVSGGLFSIAAGIAISADGAVILTDGASVQLEGNGTIGIVTDESASITVSESSIVNKDGQYQMPVVVHSGKAILESGLIEMDDTDFVRVREGAALEVMPGFMFASATLRRNGRAVNEEGKFYNGILPGIKGDLDFDGNFVLRDRFEAYPSQKTDFYNYYGFLDPIVESVELLEGTPLVYDYLKPSDLKVTLSGYAATLHLDYTVNWEGGDRFGLSGSYGYTLEFRPSPESPEGVIADTIFPYTSEMELEIERAELRFEILPELSDSVRRMYLVPIDGSDLEGAVVYAKRGPGDWGTQPIAGSLRFVEDTYLRTGDQSYEIQFIPQAEECYLSTTGTITIADVAKKDDYAQAVHFMPQSLIYGQTVGESQVEIDQSIESLIDSENSAWHAEITDRMPTVADSGTAYPYHVAPSDPENYAELDFDLPVVIGHKNIDLEWVLPDSTVWKYRSSQIIERYGFTGEGDEFACGYRFVDVSQFVGDDLASISPDDYKETLTLPDGKASAAGVHKLYYFTRERGNYRYQMQGDNFFTVTIEKGDLLLSGAMRYDVTRPVYYYDSVTVGRLNPTDITVALPDDDFDSASANLAVDYRFADKTAHLSVGSNEVDWLMIPQDSSYNIIPGTVTVANVLPRPIESVAFHYIQEIEYGIAYNQLQLKAVWNLDEQYIKLLNLPVVTIISTGYPEVATTSFDVRIAMEADDQHNFEFTGPTEYSLRLKVNPAPLKLQLAKSDTRLYYGDLQTSFAAYADSKGLLKLDEQILAQYLKADDTVEEILAELNAVPEFDALLEGDPSKVSVGEYRYGVRVKSLRNYQLDAMVLNAKLIIVKAKDPLEISLSFDGIRYLPGEAFRYTVKYKGFLYNDKPETVFSKLPVIEKTSIGESGYYDLQATSETPKNYNVKYTKHQVIVMRTEFSGEDWYIKGVAVEPDIDLTLEVVKRSESTGLYRENELEFAKFKKTTTLAHNYKATIIYRLILSKKSDYNRFENMEIGVMAPVPEKGPLLFSYYYQDPADKYQAVRQTDNGFTILNIDKLDHNGYFVLYEQKELIDYWYFFVIGIACLLIIIIAAAIAAKQYRILLAAEEAARIAAERNAIVEEIEEIIGYLDPVLYDTHVRYDEDATVAAVLKELKPYPPEHERFVRKTVKKYNRERRKMMERQIKEAAIRFRAQHTPDKNIKLK